MNEHLNQAAEHKETETIKRLIKEVVDINTDSEGQLLLL